MQIETLKVYCDLVETTSFSHSAKLNGVTQSAVSQQIRALEIKYGAVLVERGKKNFSITPEGKVFLDAARQIMEVYNSIEDRLHDLQDKVAGTLRVATVYSLGLHELPPYVKMFRQRFPDVEVRIDYVRSNQVYIDVIDGRADLGVVAFPTKRAGVLIDEFSEDRMVLICPPGHELAERRTVKLTDLRGQRVIAFEPDIPTRKAIDRVLKSEEVTVDREMEFDNIETVKRAVEVENAVSIVPLPSVQAEVKAGTLVAIEIRGADMIRQLGFVQKRSRSTSPAMREFIALLKAKGK